MSVCVALSHSMGEMFEHSWVTLHQPDTRDHNVTRRRVSDRELSSEVARTPYQSQSKPSHGFGPCILVNGYGPSSLLVAKRGFSDRCAARNGAWTARSPHAYRHEGNT